MVLKTHVQSVFLVVLVCVLAGCLGHPQRVKLSERTPVKASWIMQYPDRPEVDAVPDAVQQRSHRELGERNLAVEVAALDLSALERRRGTQARMRNLAQAEGDAPYLMLVETQVRFYTYISGKFRWQVAGKVSFAPTEKPEEIVSSPFEIAAFLDFNHQDEADALVSLSSTIATEVSRAADRYFSNLDEVRTQVTQVQPVDAVSKPARAKVAPSQADVIYFIMVDRFANGDPSNDGPDTDRGDPQAFHGGDIAGVIDNLDHLQELGVTTIWLSPIFAMRGTRFEGWGAFHGYWVDDFGRIEPRFGSAEDVERLAEELDARGMTLLLDVVLNHVGPDTHRVKSNPEWFHNRGGLEDWSDPRQLLTHDVHGLPDLDQTRPEVYAHLLETSLMWAKQFEPAGFRLDAVKHIDSEFWRRYTRDIKEAMGDDFLLLGEQLDGNPAVVAKSVEDGGFNAIFDFPLYFAIVDVFCNDASPTRLAEILSADRLYPRSLREDNGLVTFVDNHDFPRILSACHNDEDRVKSAFEFLMSARGTPSLTWGTEIDMKGAKEPDNRKSMRFVDHPRVEQLAALIDRRAEHPSLNSGRDRILVANSDTFAYLRVAPEEAHLVSVHRGAKGFVVELPDGLGSKTHRVEPGFALSRFVGEATKPLYKELEQPAKMLSIPVVVENVPTSVSALSLVGSAPEVGAWKAQDGLALKKTDEAWTGVLQVPENTAFSFKVRSVDSGNEAMEKGENRFLFATPKTELKLTYRR